MTIDVEEIQRLLGEPVTSLQPLTGGDVAESFRVRLQDGRTVFAKTHQDPPVHFFHTEASGLAWLRASGAVAVPEVLGVSEDPPLLVLEWIGEVPLGTADEGSFGRSLAGMHDAGAPSFGREDRRSTGSRALPNEPQESWALFYATQRLLPLAKICQDSECLGSTAVAGLGTIATRLPDLGGSPEPPARLHGDLWAGNRLVDATGASWLIDPAAHGGHREFDLAMMRLFGGFGPAAFGAYQEVSPLADGWEARIALHQLAPLVVHAIKFGGSYVQSASDVISRYV